MGLAKQILGLLGVGYELLDEVLRLAKSESTSSIDLW